MAASRAIDSVTRILRRHWMFLIFAVLMVHLLLAFCFYNSFSLTVAESSVRRRLPHEKRTDDQRKSSTSGFNKHRSLVNQFLGEDVDDEDDNEVLSNVLNNKYSAAKADGNSYQIQAYSLRSSSSSKATGNANELTREAAGSVYSSSNANTNSSAPLSLNLDELDFEPWCEIKTKEAISAIHRATTQRCKEEIANVSCLMQSDLLYPRSLPRYCPLKEGNFGDYVGCFKDSAKPRLLSGSAVKLSDNSPLKCLNLCLRSGYPFAGVEFKSQCFCGKQIPPFNAKIDKKHCNMTCPAQGNKANTFCGGYYTVDVYRTGLPKGNKVDPSPGEDAKGLIPVRIAFLFTVNGRAVRQVKRLIRNLYHARHFYYIHVDERQDYMYRELEKLEELLPNIRLSRRRLSTIWGGASLLQVLLNSISDLLTLPGWSESWDYVINLSESDFPIKSLNQLELFLTANKGKNFVKSHGQDTQRFVAKQGLDKTFYECDTHMWRLGDRSLPTGIRLDGGSDWVALSRDFCSYITFANNTLIRGLQKVYHHTLLPAESYFHTVLQNSEYCDSIIDNNLHVTNWRRKQGCKCQYKHIVDWCGCSPNDFKSEDWPKLQITSEKPFYFARKFEPVVNQGIINQLEGWISPSFQAIEDPALDRHWQNNYKKLDTSPSPDDGQLSLYNTLSLLTLKRILFMCEESSDTFRSSEHSSRSEKFVNAQSVHEATLYFESDFFKGILIAFDSSSGRTKEPTFEVFARQINHFIIHKTPEHIDRLINVQVCSQFDLKEQLFRNFGCILNPFSELGAKHKWAAGSTNFSTTFVWVDPSDTVAGSYEVKVETPEKDRELPLILHHKPSFRHPLRPGTWRLLVLYNWALVAETRFLVMPLMFYNGKKVSREQVKLLHNGPPQQKYIDHNFTAVEILLGLKEKQSSHLRIAITNSRRFGKDLQQWVDHLVSDFWSIQDICFISRSQLSLALLPCSTAHIDPCHLTRWSSYLPDPKSEILQLSLDSH